MSIASIWEFEAHVQSLLDESADPLDDSSVLAWLEDHPAQLEDFASLLAGASILETAAKSGAFRAPYRSYRKHWQGVAIAAALALSTWLLWPDSSVAVTEHDALARTASLPSVVYAEITVARWTPTEVTIACSIGDAPTTVRTQQFASIPHAALASGAPPRGIVAASTVYVTN